MYVTVTVSSTTSASTISSVAAASSNLAVIALAVGSKRASRSDMTSAAGRTSSSILASISIPPLTPARSSISVAAFSFTGSDSADSINCSNIATAAGAAWYARSRALATAPTWLLCLPPRWTRHNPSSVLRPVHHSRHRTPSCLMYVQREGGPATIGDFFGSFLRASRIRTHARVAADTQRGTTVSAFSSMRSASSVI